jgi:hypothetical protein
MHTAHRFLGLLAGASLAAGAHADGLASYFQQVNAQAVKGDTKAEVCLGDLYARGSGTLQDYGKAFVWYQTAAAHGEPLGKLRLAQQYQYGDGAEQDPLKAMAMFRDLAAQGYLPAATSIGELYTTGAGVPVDHAQALDWYSKGAGAGDWWAEAHLALAHQLGIGVKKDPAAAHSWSLKAANHVVDCWPTFGELVPLIIHGYLQLPDSVDVSTAGWLTITYTYQDGRAVDVRLTKSSGNLDVDAAWLAATRQAQLPPWPAAFAAVDRTQAFLIPGSDDSLDAEFMRGLNNAVRGAVIFPMEVLLKGSTGTGFANVSFDYLDGKVSDARIETSSKDPYEDAEALTAVEHAVYPPTPVAFAHQTLHLSLRVDFPIITAAKPPATLSAPAPATKKAPAAATTAAPAPVTKWR